MTTAREQLILDIFAELDRTKQPQPLEALLSPDYILHITGVDDMGPEGLHDFILSLYDAFPDLTQRIESSAEEDDIVALRLDLAGTHDGPIDTPLGMIDATGLPMRSWSLQMFRFEADQIAEQWIDIDMPSILEQLGIAFV